jgi:hypothetical protein
VPSIVLVGDTAAALAAQFEELGIAVVASPEGSFVLGVGEHAREALLHGTRTDVAGVIGIDGEPPLAEARAGALTAPVLIVVAEALEGSAYSFAKALTAHGVPNETVVYDGVEPGFLGVHDEATADVWRLVRRFMGVPAPA